MPWPGTFEVVARRRPVAVAQPGTVVPAAPCAAVSAPLHDGAGGATRVTLTSGDTVLAAVHDGERVTLEIEHGGGGTGRPHRTRHASRRHGRVAGAHGLALSLTGDRLTAWTTASDGAPTARAVVDLDVDRPDVDVHDETWLADLHAEPGPAGDPVSGVFGQLGLRDLRVVTTADGSPVADPDLGGGGVLLTATSAGPGGFRTGHTSVWRLDLTTLDLTHRADLFVRRPGGPGGPGGLAAARRGRPGVYGDHASHLLRDGDRWLLATSTWGDFDRRRHPHVTTVLATSDDDLTHGTHVLDAAPLHLPGPPASVGTWDPHLLRTDDGWLAAYVSATAFFRFHPVVAQGPELDHLTLRAAASDRIATEGPTLVRLDDTWLVAASDGRDGTRRRRARYPLLDLDLRDVGHLDAAYPTNIPWPTILAPAHETGGWLMVGFDGTPCGGGLVGYGTHGDVVVQRAHRPPPAETVRQPRISAAASDTGEDDEVSRGVIR